MVKYLNIKFEDEDEHERVKEVKRNNGLTWRGMLLYAADSLEGDESDDDAQD